MIASSFYIRPGTQCWVGLLCELLPGTQFCTDLKNSYSLWLRVLIGSRAPGMNPTFIKQQHLYLAPPASATQL